MSRQLFHCPKCKKVIRRISMSGGSFIDQGLPVPDPSDFCITLHPCSCSSSKGENNFLAFLATCKKAYEISDLVATEAPVAVAARPITSAVGRFQRPSSN
jgi:hypothetical protein